MFEYNEVSNAAWYKILILEDDSLISKNHIQEYMDSSNASLISNLKFNKSYYWKTIAYNKYNQSINQTPFHYFFIKPTAFSDTSLYKIKINKNLQANDQYGVIFLDLLNVAINRNGEVVWYIPHVNQIQYCKDIKMADDGTITYLPPIEALNIDINGRIVWQAPNDGKVSRGQTELYHHEFTKTKMGNYYILSKKYDAFKSPISPDSSIEMLEIGLIIEYNKLGDVIWSWDSKNYYTNEEILFERKHSKIYDNTTTHLNSLSIDSSEKYVYAGFRNISRIIKIDKQSNRVIAAYGPIIDPSKKEKLYGQDFFRRQHGANILANGNIAVFNNNSEGKNYISSAVIFSQKQGKANSVKKIWEFKLNFDFLTDGKSYKWGNMVQLKNGNLFISEGTINRTIEVTPDKTIVWDAFFERYSEEDKKWIPFPQYRTSYSSSLYPYYFTTNSLKKGDANLSFNIVNEGTEPDGYEITVTSKEKIIYQKQTSTIPPNKLLNLSIPISISFEELKVLVKSNHSKKERIITP